MKVKFKEARVVQDEHAGTPQETRFEIGREYDLPTASAQRWINRGAADAVDAPAPVAASAPVAAPAATPDPAPAATPEPDAPKRRRARLDT